MEKNILSITVGNIFVLLYFLLTPITFLLNETCILAEFFIKADCAVLIGDSTIDYEAAIENNLNFFLRKTKLNYSLQVLVKNNLIENFLED